MTRLPGESFRLMVLRRQPGMLWTTSSYESGPGPGCLRLALGGPRAVDGVLQAVAPVPRAVYLDGQPLAETASGPEGYVYEADLGVLHLRYAHEATRDRWVDCGRD